MKRILATGLTMLCGCSSCGKITTDGGPPDTSSWGTACQSNASSVMSHPPCDLDAGIDAANASCQTWASSIVSGASGQCDDGTCLFGLGKGCAPGPQGDSECQAWFQTFSKIPIHAKCWPPGPNDPATNGNFCVAADTCGVNSKSGYSYCNCGSQPQCAFSQGSLCLDTGGVVSCGPWCQ